MTGCNIPKPTRYPETPQRMVRRMKEYIVSQEYIDGIYTDEGSTFGLDMQKELIHCRNCKHRMHNGTCIKNMKRKPDDGFCDEGEANEW